MDNIETGKYIVFIMGFYYYLKLVYILYRRNIQFALILTLTCAFFLNFLVQNNSSGKLSNHIIGRQNKQFRFGGTNLEDFYNIGYKSRALKGEYFIVTENSFVHLFSSAVVSSKRGLLVYSFQTQDKMSIIKNFLCYNPRNVITPECDRVLYHHTCTFDDTSSRDPIPFVVELAREVAAIVPHAWLKIDLEKYSCVLTPGNYNCVYDLIINPLKTYAKDSAKIYLIVINFIDDCYFRYDKFVVSILHILQVLANELPLQFKFVAVSKGWVDEELITRVFGVLQKFRLFDVLQEANFGISTTSYTVNELTGIEPGKEVGYCYDATDVMLIILLLWLTKLSELHAVYYDPLFLVWCIFNIKFAITLGSILFSAVICFIVYVRYILKEPQPLVIDKETFVEQRRMTIGELNRSDLSEFELLYQMKYENVQKNQTQLRNMLLQASEKKLSITCRWLMLHTSNNGVSNRIIDKALDVAFKNSDSYSAKAISWTITKYFFRTFHAHLNSAFEIYPAIHCKGHPTDRQMLCSRHKVIAIHSNRKISGVPSTYKAFKIKFFITMTGDSFVEKQLLKRITDFMTTSRYLKLTFPPEVAENIFKKHSNLALIFPCAVRPVIGNKGDVSIVEEHCLLLFCWKKSFIPIGDNHFPRSIQGIPTLLVEGIPTLISKLRIGDKIGTQQSNGTLGGFINYHGFDSFLTCAHVMYDLNTLVSSDFFSIPESSAYNYMTNPPVPCGKVIRKVFDHDDRSKTSIDAAVVLMQNTTIDPNDYISGTPNPSCYANIGLNTKYINESICLHHEEFCLLGQSSDVVAAGAMTKLEKQNVKFSKQDDFEVEFPDLGQTAAHVNGNTFRPLVISHPAHMQLSAGVPGQKRVFCMYNQIVLNLDLKPGDSGSCIYIINNPYNKNGCIGMAIAFCNGFSIVTPMKDILKRISQ